MKLKIVLLHDEGDKADATFTIATKDGKHELSHTENSVILDVGKSKSIADMKISA